MSRPMYTVTIADAGDVGADPNALRHVLESFGARVIKHNIGRANDLIDLLSGNFYIPSDYVILEFHGEDGEIIMPALGEDIYTKDEPRGNFGPKEIEKYYKIGNAFIINQGCSLGYKELADSFIYNGARAYIGARDDIEGSSSVFFTIRFFYELIQNRRSEKEAFLLAQNTDSETQLFEWFQK